MNPDDETFEQKLRELMANAPVLSSSEELDLILRSRATDHPEAHEARRVLEAASVRLVYSIAKKYTQDRSLAECYDAGRQGWARALERFDPDKGFKFGTYASWWVRQTITRESAP